MEQERRRDYPDIIEKLDDIKTEMTDTRLEAKRIATLVEERNMSALQWRSDVCRKFDRIFKWLDSLPCKERSGTTKAMEQNIVRIWAVLIVILGAIAGLAWVRK